MKRITAIQLWHWLGTTYYEQLTLISADDTSLFYVHSRNEKNELNTHRHSSSRIAKHAWTNPTCSHLLLLYPHQKMGATSLHTQWTAELKQKETSENAKFTSRYPTMTEGSVNLSSQTTDFPPWEAVECFTNLEACIPWGANVEGRNPGLGFRV